MGRDVIDMVEIAIFLGLILLVCLVVTAIAFTGLLLMYFADLAIEMWGKLRYK